MADANLERPAKPNEHRLRLIGNLPYNISTPLMFRFLDQADCIEDMHLMLQKEVVDRMTAEPGTKVYGRLSVMVQTFCSAQRLFLVSAGAFHPAPKVSSAVVRLRPHRPLPHPLADPHWHARIVAAAFAQRRKTLRNSLSGLVEPEQMIAQAIDPSARAETLSVADFAALANATSACIAAQIP
jgi:16S rRNA (adenine1518-N6/adenine1519-N6)-dimethyltransferase